MHTVVSASPSSGFGCIGWIPVIKALGRWNGSVPTSYGIAFEVACSAHPNADLLLFAKNQFGFCVFVLQRQLQRCIAFAEGVRGHAVKSAKSRLDTRPTTRSLGVWMVGRHVEVTVPVLLCCWTNVAVDVRRNVLICRIHGGFADSVDWDLLHELLLLGLTAASAHHKSNHDQEHECTRSNANDDAC